MKTSNWLMSVLRVSLSLLMAVIVYAFLVVWKNARGDTASLALICTEGVLCALLLFLTTRHTYWWTPTRAKASRYRGFTLLETLIVVAILSLVAAIALPGFFNARKQRIAEEKIERARTELLARINTATDAEILALAANNLKDIKSSTSGSGWIGDSGYIDKRFAEAEECLRILQERATNQVEKTSTGEPLKPAEAKP